MEVPSEIAVVKSMSDRLVTTHPAESARSAFEKMERRGVHHLPVIDESGKLIGLLSSRDFYRALADDFTKTAAGPTEAGLSAETLQGQMASRSSGATIRSIHELNPRMIVRDFMTMHPTAISPETEVREAAQIMIDEKISALVVVDSDKVVGMITHEDMLRVLTEVLGGPSQEFRRVEALLYNSPLSQVVNAISNAGL